MKDLLLELGASVSKFDPAVFYWVDGHGDVYRVLACHVDDFIWGGKPEFENVVSKIRSILQVGQESNQAFKYCGIDLEHDNDSMTYLCNSLPSPSTLIRQNNARGADRYNITLLNQDQSSSLLTSIRVLYSLFRLYNLSLTHSRLLLFFARKELVFYNNASHLS